MQQIDGGNNRRNNESGGVRDQEETGERGPSADQTWVAERCWPRSPDTRRVSPVAGRAHGLTVVCCDRWIAAQRRPGACACEQPSRIAKGLFGSSSSKCLPGNPSCSQSLKKRTHRMYAWARQGFSAANQTRLGIRTPCLAKSDVWELPGKLMFFVWPGKCKENMFGLCPGPEKLI